jgi:inward rectifier potassium channel
MAHHSPGIRPSEFRSTFPRIQAVGRAFAPHKDIYHLLLRCRWWQFFAFICGAFLAINALFGWIYCSEPGSIANARPGSFEDAFYFSVQTLATIGYGGMSPVTRLAHLTVTLEALCGIISVALVTGLTFAKFSRPTARIVFSDRMVIAPRDGVPHLMFRLANWRHNQVVEAQLRVLVLVNERTAEGETLRRLQELSLVRDRNALFSLTWLALHRIEPGSLFHGRDAFERLRAQDAQIFLSFNGFDETVGQNIHARHAYALDDVVQGGRFADILTVLPDGTRQLDYRLFHKVLLEEGPPSQPSDRAEALSSTAPAIVNGGLEDERA